MPADIPNSAFRLRWRATWPDKPDDFVARVGPHYCRIYRMNGGPQDGRWYWCAARDAALGSGHGDTARAAALEAERRFFG